MSLEIRYTLPNQPTQVVPIDSSRFLIGTLLSNEVVLRAPGVDPIHAMIEEGENNEKVIVDLGSTTGVKVNGERIEVEKELCVGDVIVIGEVIVDVLAAGTMVSPNIEALTTEVHAHSAVAAKTFTQTTGGERRLEAATVPYQSEPKQNVTTQGEHIAQQDTQSTRLKESQEHKDRRDMLFSPRKAKPSGNVLEVVAYWGDSVLDVELFHPQFKGYELCTIGNPTKAHLIDGSMNDLERHVLANINKGDEGYQLRLLDGMKARIRKEGKVGEKDGPSKLQLGKRDIAHITHGAVAYFMMFVKPPDVILPPNKTKDPIFLGLFSLSMLFYFITVPFLWLSTPKDKTIKEDDAWTMVHVPEREKPEEKKEVQQKEKPKPPVKIAEKKEPPKPKPPVPKPAVVKAKPPVQPPKPVPPPKEPPKVAEAKDQPKTPTPTPVKQSRVEQLLGQIGKAAGPEGDKGMASTGATTPDFKRAGPRTSSNDPKTGGAAGSGMGQKGGGRKGTGRVSVMGVEGVKNNKASGVNLSKLGLGAGKILNRTGAGAIHTKFQNSAGGAGGGEGHMGKTYGFGGMGTGSSLGLAGTGSAINNFGSGSGGSGSGEGGSGGRGGSGLSGSGLGSGFGDRGTGSGGGGQGRANVIVPPGDPLVSGGLSSQEVQAVIRANLNQIRHCYEQLLQRSPRASGKIKVEFIVAVNGRVSNSSILESSIQDAMMKSCVTGKIVRWKFPQPRGGKPVTVKYPFVFNPI